MTREPVLPTPRGSMSRARRLRIYLACNGRCECGCKVEMVGTVIDHRIPLFMGGSDDDTNLRFLCGPCDRIKTGGDKGDIGKVKRILARNDGTRRPRKAIQSAGFSKTLKKRFDGTVVTK